MATISFDPHSPADRAFVARVLASTVDASDELDLRPDEDVTAGTDVAYSEAEAKQFISALWNRIGDNAKALLREMAAFPEGEPGWLSRDLADKLEITVGQLTGRRANLGRSLKAAAEEIGADSTEITEWAWDDDAGNYRYWLAPPIRKAILAMG